MVLRSIPLGIAYAIWSGAGIVLVALVGWLVFKQHLDLAAIIGICMILGGVVVINLFSQNCSNTAIRLSIGGCVANNPLKRSKKPCACLPGC